MSSFYKLKLIRRVYHMYLNLDIKKTFGICLTTGLGRGKNLGDIKDMEQI